MERCGMNFFRELKQQVKDGIQVYTISGILCIIFYQLITHLSTFTNAFAQFKTALAPFIYGLVFAFLLLPLRNLVENKVLVNTKISSRMKRVISVIVCIAVTVVVVVGFFWILIPQLVSSITTFSESINGYIEQVKELLLRLEESDFAPVSQEAMDLLDRFGIYVRNWLTGEEGGIGQILNYTLNVGKSIVNILVGFIIAVFVLADSEMFAKQMKELNYSLLPESAADSLVYVLRLNKDMFNRFIFGKALDSLIIGVICYISVVLLRFPYPVLIAFVIGITNMIPFFGPFIGAVPCFLILVLISPIKALEFAAFILVLQQFDGNLLGPYILGDSMGLPTLWIMFAILVAGSLFGILGMLVGVPVFSVIYVLLGDWIHARLRQKRIVINDTK